MASVAFFLVGNARSDFWGSDRSLQHTTEKIKTLERRQRKHLLYPGACCSPSLSLPLPTAFSFSGDHLCKKPLLVSLSEHSSVWEVAKHSHTKESLPVGSPFRRYLSALLGHREASGRDEQSQSHHHCSLLPSESVFRPWAATNLTGVCTKIMWSITWLQALTIQTFYINPFYYEVFYFHAGTVWIMIDQAKGHQSLLRCFLTWSF